MIRALPRRPARHALRAVVGAALAVAALAVAPGCGLGDPTDPEDDAIAQLRLIATASVGSGAGTVAFVVLEANGRVVGGRLPIATGTTQLTGLPANDQGVSISPEARAAHRLTVVVPPRNPGGITFEPDPADPYRGTLTATTETQPGGDVLVSFGVQRVSDGVWVLGPFPVPVFVILGPR